MLKEESRQEYLADPGAEAVRQATPLRQIATAEDVAAVVALLCGVDMSLVTGQELVVDGLSLLWQESLIRHLHAAARDEP